MCTNYKKDFILVKKYFGSTATVLRKTICESILVLVL